MQRPTPTARRFYTAFYRWSLLNARFASASEARNGYSHLYHKPRWQRAQTPDNRAQNVSTRHFSSCSANKREMSVATADANHAIDRTAAQSQAWRKWLRESQVQPSADKPFDTLNAWEDVVRYRSGAGVMVQTSVPASRIHGLREQFGDGLRDMVEKLFGGDDKGGGTRIEVDTDRIKKQNSINEAPYFVRSVLYSGTMEEVERIRRELGRFEQSRIEGEPGGLQGARGNRLVRMHKSDRTGEGSRRLELEGNMRGSERELVVRRGQFRETRQGYMKLPPGPPKASSAMDYDTAVRTQSHRTATPAKQANASTLQSSQRSSDLPLWLQQPPTSQDSVPATSLEPYTFILRSYDPAADHVHISVVVPWSTVQSKSWDRSVGGLNAVIQAKISRPKRPFKSRDGREMVDYDISGTVEQVQWIRDGIVGLARRERGEGPELEGSSVGGEGPARNSANTPSMNPSAAPPVFGTSPSEFTTVEESYTPLPSWLLTPPKSRTEMPSAYLQPLQPVLRDRSQDSRHLHVEVVVPANQKWDEEVMILMQQPRSSDVSIDVEAPFSRMDESTGESHWRRPLMLRGSSKEILGVVEMIEGMRRKVLGLSGGEVNAKPATQVIPGLTQVRAPGQQAQVASTFDARAAQPITASSTPTQRRASRQQAQVVRDGYVAPDIRRVKENSNPARNATDATSTSTSKSSDQREFFARITVPQAVADIVLNQTRRREVLVSEVERDIDATSIENDHRVFLLRTHQYSPLVKTLRNAESAARARLVKNGRAPFAEGIGDREGMGPILERARSSEGVIKILEAGRDGRNGREVWTAESEDVTKAASTAFSAMDDEMERADQHPKPHFFYARIAFPQSVEDDILDRLRTKRVQMSEVLANEPDTTSNPDDKVFSLQSDSFGQMKTSLILMDNVARARLLNIDIDSPFEGRLSTHDHINKVIARGQSEEAVVKILEVGVGDERGKRVWVGNGREAVDKADGGAASSVDGFEEFEKGEAVVEDDAVDDEDPVAAFDFAMKDSDSFVDPADESSASMSDFEGQTTPQRAADTRDHSGDGSSASIPGAEAGTAPRQYMNNAVFRFYARVAVPESSVDSVMARVFGLAKAGDISGARIYRASGSDDDTDVDNTETVILVRAVEKSTLHVVVQTARKFAREVLGLAEHRLSAPDPKHDRVGRIIEMGTTNEQRVNMPDADAAWYGRYMSRSSLDRFSFYSRLALHASVAPLVISMRRFIERKVGDTNCRIRAESERANEGNECFVEVWTRDEWSFERVKNYIRRTVRSSAKKVGLAEAEAFDVRVVDKDGNDVFVRKDEQATAVDRIEDDSEVDRVEKFDELYRSSRAAVDNDEEAETEATDNAMDSWADEATERTAEAEISIDEAVFSPFEDEATADTDIQHAAAYSSAYNSDKPLKFESKITMPARHAEYVTPKIPEVAAMISSPQYSSSDTSINIEPPLQSAIPDRTTFRVSAASDWILTKTMRSIAWIARESFLQEGVRSEDAPLRGLSGGTQWFLDYATATPTLVELGASRILPMYRRLAVPAQKDEDLQRRIFGRLRTNTNCIAFRMNDVVEEQSDENPQQMYMLWGSTEEACEEAIEWIQRLVLKRSGHDSDRLNSEYTVKVLEQGVDDEGCSRMNRDYILRADERQYAQASEYCAYSTFTLPRTTLKDVDASLQEMVYATRCQLLQINPPEVFVDEQQVSEKHRIFTLWGQTGDQVQRGKQMIENASQDSLDAQDVDDAALSVLQEGVSEATIRGLMESQRRMERKRVKRQVANEFQDPGLSSGQRLDFADLAIADSSDAQTFFESAEDSEELDGDDGLFPEFNSPPADDSLPNTGFGRPSLANMLPSIDNGFKGPRKLLQQRAYSTVQRPPRAGAAEERSQIQSDDIPNRHNQTPEQLTENIKLTLRTFTHPVVVITSRTKGGDGEDRLSICRGVTVSSFNTVTLSPVPIISLNLRVPSRSWDAINETGKLAVHVLPATPEGAAIAHAFTQPYDEPSEPFRRLQQLGVVVLVDRGDRRQVTLPPTLKHDAIMARIRATLLHNKCVHVGDHVVIVAKVTSVNLLTPEIEGSTRVVDEHDALAYAQKGYRNIGTGVVPVDLPELESSVETSSNKSASQAATSEPQTEESGDGQDSEVRSNEESEAPPSLPVENFFEQLEMDGSENEPPTPSPQPVIQQTYEYAGPPPPPPRHGPKRGTPNPFGISRTTNAPYSTIRLRFYSTSSPILQRENASERKSNPIDMVSDPEILSTSVASFLGVPENTDENVRLPHIHGLMRLQKEARVASRRLERALADGSLTTEESAHLENIITRNERKVAKVLALRSAKILRRLLDQGRVDYKQVQWLETNIEKGQVALLEEARQLRRMLDEKTIANEQVQMARQKLEQQNQVLSAEATRLRQMVDEESDGGGAASRDFDGFRGNV